MTETVRKASRSTGGDVSGSRQTFDHRTRQWSPRPWLVLHASDPVNGLDERLPRVWTLLLGPWKVTLSRRRTPWRSR